MRRVATNSKIKTPEQVSQIYIDNKDAIDYELQLNKQEKEMFRNPGTGFINCDTSCLYKIIRYHELVEEPNEGWLKKVNRLSTNGDFVETLRQLRNRLLHRPNARFTETEIINLKSNFCKVIMSVSKLFDENEELKHQFKSYMEWP